MTQVKFSPETRKAILANYNIPDAKQARLLAESDARFAACLLKIIREDAELLQLRLFNLGLKPPSASYKLATNIIIQVNSLISACELVSACEGEQV